MQNFKNLIILNLLLMLLLSSCGFHLRGLNGDYKFPFNKIYLECDNIIICSNFSQAVKTQSLATRVNTPESANVTIKLYDEQTSRVAQTFNAAGRISTYALTYQAKAKVTQKNVQLGNDLSVSVTSIMNYNDSTLLSANTNEATFWDNLHQKATDQLIRELVYFKYYKTEKQNANTPK